MVAMEETRELNGSENGRALLNVTVERVTGLISHPAEETLAVEEPLEIQLGYGQAGNRAVKSISVTMRTPGYDFELAAGFLMTEGVLRDANDIDRIFYAVQSNMNVSDERQSGADHSSLSARKKHRPRGTVHGRNGESRQPGAQFLYDIQLRDLRKGVFAGVANGLSAAPQQ